MFSNLLRSASSTRTATTCIAKRLYGYVEFSEAAIQSERVSDARNVDPNTSIGVKSREESAIVIPLQNDAKLVARYENMFGGVRVGKLLEDIDAFAARVAYKHCDGFNPARPLTVVTASVDKLRYALTFDARKSIKLEGHLTYVGSSSMEVRVTASSVDDTTGRSSDAALDCLLTMVARDRYSGQVSVSVVCLYSVRLCVCAL